MCMIFYNNKNVMQKFSLVFIKKKKIVLIVVEYANQTTTVLYRKYTL